MFSLKQSGQKTSLVYKVGYPAPWCCLLGWIQWSPSSWRRWRAPWGWRPGRSRRWTCWCCKWPSSTRQRETRCPARWTAGWRSGGDLWQMSMNNKHSNGSGEWFPWWPFWRDVMDSVFATISFFANNLFYKCSPTVHQKIYMEKHFPKHFKKSRNLLKVILGNQQK